MATSIGTRRAAVLQELKNELRSMLRLSTMSSSQQYNKRDDCHGLCQCHDDETFAILRGIMARRMQVKGALGMVADGRIRDLGETKMSGMSAVANVRSMMY